MAQGTFGTAINCMDGRVQQPVIDWMRFKFGLDHIDMITEPGPDKIVAANNADEIASILNRVKISVEQHGSRHIAISGHGDCAGNPVSKHEHFEHVKAAMQVIKSWNLPVNIYGVWIDEKWQVEVIDSFEPK